MNNNIPTAEEYVRYEDHRNYHDFDKTIFTGKQLKEFMIGYTRHHVKAALEAVAENIVVEDVTTPNCEDHTPYYGACVSCGRTDNPDIIIGNRVNKDSILNAYPLDNIK